jgi:hypothetical protein
MFFFFDVNKDIKIFQNKCFLETEFFQTINFIIARRRLLEV